MVVARVIVKASPERAGRHRRAILRRHPRRGVLAWGDGGGRVVLDAGDAGAGRVEHREVATVVAKVVAQSVFSGE